MNKQEILDRLRENEAALRAQGVAHAASFGSVARGEARLNSDIDIMVEIAPEIPMGVFQYVGIVHAIEDLFPVRVDVSNRVALKPHVRPSAERDAICLLSPLGRSISSCMISAADSDEASHAFQ